MDININHFVEAGTHRKHCCCCCCRPPPLLPACGLVQSIADKTLKVLDFMDTVFIVLKKSWRQLSFLHVYHHCTIFLVRPRVWFHSTKKRVSGFLPLSWCTHGVWIFFACLVLIGDSAHSGIFPCPPCAGHLACLLRRTQ